MKLVLVESPTKAKTLSRYLGKDYRVEASLGHVRDLPKGHLGIDIEKNFKPEYVVDERKESVVKQLQSLTKKASEVILATDPDREGEAIAFHLRFLLKTKKDKFVRITFHEITKTAIKQALAKPGKINLKLVDAQQGRRVLDRLVGYKLSPLLWRKIRRGLSAGRVQSPAVRLIVEKEAEIKKFKPEEFWKISVKLSKKNQQNFLALLTKIGDKLLKIDNKGQAEKICNILKKSEFRVKKVTKKEAHLSPPPPFITSTLQRTAVNVFGWSGKRTMSLAQRLYEKGLITYHRTDSVHIASQAIEKCRHFVLEIYGKDYLVPQTRFYKTQSRLAQEAHEAIRPTRMKSKGRLKTRGPAAKLYRLIFNRFLATQMTDHIIDRTKAEIEASNKEKPCLFLAEGEVEKFDGWKKIYEKKTKINSKNLASLESIPLPELVEGEELKLLKILPEQKFTQPPARYTEASLIKALEERGIGRPSTYAPIVSTIQARQYVEKKEGKFYATPVGETVIEFLVKHFKNIVDYDFTAEMEDGLDKIAEGKKDWELIIKNFYKPFEKKLKYVAKNAKREKIETEKIGKKCPECKKGEQVVRIGRFGKFLSCSRFPDCKWTAPFVEQIKGIRCPKCKGKIVIRKTKKGRQFFGCSNYPKCDWASWKKPKQKL